MKKAVIFGLGACYENSKCDIEKEYEIVLLIDNDLNKGDAPKTILDVEYDTVIITPYDFKSMYDQLICLGVKKEKITHLMLLNPDKYVLKNLGVRSYSEHGEDLIVIIILQLMGVEKPTYIDVGANHPYEISNTALLHEAGCWGINIEANPNMLELFNIARPVALNINLGVSPNKGVEKFYMFDEISGLNSFSLDAVAYSTKKFNVSLKKELAIECDTLMNIVDMHCHNVFPDFLDIDIEGLDYDVLSGCDFSEKGPKVVCAEAKECDVLKFDAMMQEKGFFRFCRVGANSIYIKNAYVKKVCRLDIPL